MSTALGVLQTVLGVVVVGGWLLRVLRGEERFRDERGRLRPGYAVVVTVGGVCAVGLVAVGLATLV